MMDGPPLRDAPREQTLALRTQHGEAPLQLIYPDGPGPFPGTILVYHGLGACKEVQRPECRILADHGFLAVGVDAWGHGARGLPELESLLRGPDTHRTLLEMVHRSIEEIPAIVDGLTALLGPATGPLGIMGISMGGYIVFGATSRERRIRAAVSILGSPDWTVGAKGDEWLLGESPHLRAQTFAPTALLMINAGLDTSVPPLASRAFAEALAPCYQATPDRLRYLEYPHSGHFMRDVDWHDAWRVSVSWARRFLGAQ
jgi:uncharacterized protein